MAGHHDRDRVGAERGTHRSRGLGSADTAGDLPVGGEATERDPGRGSEDILRERAHEAPVEADLEAVPRAPEVLVELATDVIRGARRDQDPGRQLTGEPVQHPFAVIAFEGDRRQSARGDGHEQLADRRTHRCHGHVDEAALRRSRAEPVHGLPRAAVRFLRRDRQSFVHVARSLSSRSLSLRNPW